MPASAVAVVTWSLAVQLQAWDLYRFVGLLVISATADPPRNVLEQSLDYFHVLDKSLTSIQQVLQELIDKV